MSAFMILYTIYERPSDHPSHFVVRGHEILRKGGTRPQTDFKLADTLDEARRCIPPGYVNIGREPEDDSSIVETWI